MTESNLLQRAGALTPLLREHRRAIDASKRLPEPVVEALVDIGALRCLAPASVGGPELSPSSLVSLIEAIAIGDAAAAWITMVAGTTSVAAGYLSSDGAREVFADPKSVACGVFAPMGKGARVEGGHRVTGRWSFGSGVLHAKWVLGGFVVMDERGAPSMMQGFFDRREVEVIETWDTLGMRGSGSHDFAVKDAFLPDARLLTLTRAPRESGLTYRFPLFGLLALGVSAVATGIARTALDEVRTLATMKRPMGGKRTLAERELVQVDVSRAELELAAARALVRETVTAVETRVAGGDAMTTSDRALLRGAATHATQAAARAVDLAHRIAGSSSIHESSLLAQCFRDVHVATQHAMVADPVHALVGRVMLGLPTDDTLL